jgi:hypothetical protein
VSATTLLANSSPSLPTRVLLAVIIQASLCCYIRRNDQTLSPMPPAVCRLQRDCTCRWLQCSFSSQPWPITLRASLANHRPVLVTNQIRRFLCTNPQDYLASPRRRLRLPLPLTCEQDGTQSRHHARESTHNNKKTKRTIAFASQNLSLITLSAQIISRRVYRGLTVCHRASFLNTCRTIHADDTNYN